MSRPDSPPMLAPPPKLSALGLAALLAAPGGPSVFFPPVQAAASPVPIPTTETMAVHATPMTRPHSRRGRRRATAKLRVKQRKET